MGKRLTAFLAVCCLVCGLWGCGAPGAQKAPDSAQNRTNEAEKEDTNRAEGNLSEQNENVTGQNALTEQGDSAGQNVSAGQSVSAEEGKGPRVFVDADGYGTDEKKLVFFWGDEKSGTFQVVSADTRETVYTGTMRASVSENDTGVYLQKGDFSSLTEPGNYYIEASHIGRSYSFRIGESPFEDLCDTLLTAMEEEAEQTAGVFLYRSQALSWMLRYQEYYGETEGSLNPGTMPELLVCARELGERLAEDWEEKNAADTSTSSQTGLTDEEIAYYCGAMAQLYEALKEYDAREANIFLREATGAYEALYKRRGADFDETLLFYDAAVLYKATGQTKYHSLIKTYLKNDSQRTFFEEDAAEEELLSDEAYVYGAVAYMSTLYKVDTALCDSLMENLKDGAERIVADCEANDYFSVSTDRRNRVLSDRLYLVAIIEHVVVSKEYVEILQSGIHYINGCNESGAGFVTESGVYDPANDEKYSDAALGGAYLFILGEIMESEAEE